MSNISLELLDDLLNSAKEHKELRQSSEEIASSSDVGGDQVVWLTTIYDYEPVESHLLSFKAGETLKLVSKACHPWWEAERNGVAGFVGSNYVVEVVGKRSISSLPTESSEKSTDKSDSAKDLSTEKSEIDEDATENDVSPFSTFRSEAKGEKHEDRLVAAVVAHAEQVQEFQEKADSRLNRSRSGGNIANPLYSKSKARPASLIIPKESLASAFEEEEEDPKGPRRSKSTIIKEPSSPLIKRPFSRSRSGTTVSASDSISSGEPSPGSVPSPARAQSRSRAASVVQSTPSIFGMTLGSLMPRAHSPPMFLVRLLAKLEGSRGIEAPEIFLKGVEREKLVAFKEKLNANDLSVISTEKNPYMLGAVLLEWLRELPLSVIPPDMYVLFCEAEKIHCDDEHLLHSIHSLVNSMPKAHRTCLQYVCFIFKNVAAASHLNGMTLQRLSPIVAPILMRPRAGTSALVVSTQNGSLRWQRVKNEARSLDSLHVDELPPLQSETSASDDPVVAAVQAEYERRSGSLVPGKITFELLIQNFLELFMNESVRMRFTTKAGESRDVLSAGTLQVIVHKLYDKFYVDMLDPEFPHIVLLMRDYFVARDADLLRLLRSAYLKNKVSAIPWQEVVRLRVLNVLKLFADNYLPELGICQPEFAEMWHQLISEMDGEQSVYNRATAEQLATVIVMSEGSEEAQKALNLQLAMKQEKVVKAESPLMLTSKTDLTDLANALTLFSSNLFRSIQPVELMHRNWQKKESSQYYSALVDNFALYQGWAVHQILTCSEKDRSSRVNQIVDLAFKLLDLNNFHVCFAIYAGVVHPSVSRLKMWEKLGKLKDRLTELTTLFDPSLNHKNYQTALRSAQQPVIPQISMYSKYLFAIEENNEDWIVAKAKPGSSSSNVVGNSGEKMVNIQKLRMLYVLIRQLRQYQRVMYTVKCSNQEMLMQVFSNSLPCLEEKAMYEMSQKVQPREEKK